MSDRKHEMLPGELPESVREERRDFLISLGRWSKAVIGGVLLGGLLVPGRDAEAGDWGNRGGGRGGSWINFGGGWGWGPQPWGWGWYNRPGTIDPGTTGLGTIDPGTTGPGTTAPVGAGAGTIADRSRFEAWFR